MSQQNVLRTLKEAHTHSELAAPPFAMLLTELRGELEGRNKVALADMLPLSTWHGKQGDNRVTLLQPHNFLPAEDPGRQAAGAGSGELSLHLPLQFVPRVSYGKGAAWPVHPGAALDQDLTRAEPMVVWPGVETGTGSGAVDTGQGLHTLIMFDPDAPGPAQPSSRSWLHWLVTNVRPAVDKGTPGTAPAHGVVYNVRSGEEVVAYAPPTPPMGTHRYIVLIAARERSGGIDAQGLASTLDRAGRGKFDVPGFLASQGLKVVGMTWYTVSALGGQ